jgi:hypothetical protein
MAVGNFWGDLIPLDQILGDVNFLGFLSADPLASGPLPPPQNLRRTDID